MDEQSKRRGPGCLGIILFGALLLSGFFNIMLLFTLGITAAGEGPSSRMRLPRFDETLFMESNTAKQGDASKAGGSPEEKAGADAKESDRIALIDLKGLIASEIDGEVGESMVEDMEIALRQAASDDNVKAILLQIESPGGEVTASDRIYHAIKTARGKKPVVVFLGSIAASGGFYAACGGSHIIANETTFTGSIGVIISTINFESLLGKVGLYPVVFKSGKFKDTLSGTRPMTDEENELVQSIVMQAYEKFLSIVSTERKLDAAALRVTVADGRVLTGADALKAGLIDSTGQFEDAYAKARELGAAPGAQLVRYEAGFKLGSFFRAFSQSSVGPQQIRLELAPSFAAQLQPGRLYFLPGALGGF